MGSSASLPQGSGRRERDQGRHGMHALGDGTNDYEG